MDLDREVGRLDRRIDGMGERIAKIEDLAIRYQLEEIKKDLEGVIRRLDTRDQQREIERRDAIKERKSDRRWQFGASLTAAGLVVSAVGLFVAVFGAGP